MARKRIVAAQRKLAQRSRQSAADVIGLGVAAVARQVAAVTPAGSLWWWAPMQYITEQLAPRLVAQYRLPAGVTDDVAAYVLAGLNEYLLAFVGQFDAAHFERWRMAGGVTLPVSIDSEEGQDEREGSGSARFGA